MAAQCSEVEMVAARKESGVSSNSARQAQHDRKRKCSGNVPADWLDELLEFELGDFAGGGAGKAFEDVDFAGEFVLGEAFVAVAEDVFGVELGVGRGADEGNGEFAFAVGPAADDGGFGDAGILVEDFFDLARVDVHAVNEEHFFFAVDDEDVAVGVYPAHVAGVEPAVTQCDGVLVGLVPVAAHDVGAADDDLANGLGGEFGIGVVEDFDFDVGDGEADGAGFAHAVDGVERDDGRSFAEAVAFEEGESEFLAELVEGFAGQGSGTGDGEAEVEKPMNVEGDMGVDHGLEKMGDADEDGGAGTDDFLNGVVEWLDGFDEDDGGADAEGGEDADGEHEAVEHGQNEGEPVALGLAEDADATIDVGGEVGMGEHGTLGFAGGTGGVDDDGEVIELRFDKARLCGGGPVEVGQVEDADTFDLGGDFVEVGVGDECGELAVVGDVLDFGGL